tara:strand:- start:18334 stop:20565 length:2232 start_codon:yes stop_codon:yes gene_type:complete
MEKKEIVELSEKDIKKKINNIADRDSYENISADFEEKRAAMALLGFGNSSLSKDLFQNQEIELPKMTDKKFIGEKLMQFSSEMITSPHIDLELLQEIIKVQNNIEDSNIPLSNEVKEILIEDKVLESIKGLERESNLKRLKANIEEGRIDDQQEWIKLLKKNTDYDRIELSQEEQQHFVSQHPVNQPASAEIKEQSNYKSKPQIPVVQKDMEEYWREKYIQKMNEYGLTEVHMDKYLKQTNRKYKDNKHVAKLYNAYDWLLDRTVYPFKEVSISKLDDEYNIPTYSLFKESRSGKGVKFNQLPEPGHDMAYELAALKVRESGIQKPYVYATKPTSNQDLIQKNRFVENQINALIEYADYDINDIDVPHQFKPILEKIKKEQEMKQAMVLDQEELLQKVINGNTNQSEREMFLDKINITENVNGELISKNFDMNNPNDVKLIEKISEGKIIEDKGEGENNLLNLLKEKFQFAKTYVPETPAPTLEDADLNAKEANPADKKTADNSTDDPLLDSSLTVKENALLSEENALIKFNNYDESQTTPETKVHDNLEAILSLKNKLDKPEIAEQLNAQQKDLIFRKGTIIETFRNNPEMNNSERKIIQNLLGGADVKRGWGDLNNQPQELYEYDETIKKYGLKELDATVKKLVGLGENSNKPNTPKPENNSNTAQTTERKNAEFPELVSFTNDDDNNDFNHELPANYNPQNSNEPDMPEGLEKNKVGNTNKPIQTKRKTNKPSPSVSKPK